MPPREAPDSSSPSSSSVLQSVKERAGTRGRDGQEVGRQRGRNEIRERQESVNMWLKWWSGEGQMFWYNDSCSDANTRSKFFRLKAAEKEGKEQEDI